jgi:hypothetical protein
MLIVQDKGTIHQIDHTQIRKGISKYQFLLSGGKLMGIHVIEETFINPNVNPTPHHATFQIIRQST